MGSDAAAAPLSFVVIVALVVLSISRQQASSTPMTGCIGRERAGGIVVGGSDECDSTGGGDPTNDHHHHLHKKRPHPDDNSHHENNNNKKKKDYDNSDKDKVGDNGDNSGVSPRIEDSLSGGDDSYQQEVHSRQDVMTAIACSESGMRVDALPVGDGNGECHSLVGDSSNTFHDTSTSQAPKQQRPLPPRRNVPRIPQQKEHTRLEQQLELKKYPFLVRCRSLPSLVQRTPDGKRPTEITYEIAELTVLNHIFMRIEYRYDTVCPFCGFRAACLRKLQKHLPRFHRDHHAFTFNAATTTTNKSTMKDDIKGVCIVAVPSIAYLREKIKQAGHIPRLKDGRDQFQFIRIRNEYVLGRTGWRRTRRMRKRRRHDDRRHYLGRNEQPICTRRAIEPLEPLPDRQLWQQGSLPNPWPVPESVTNPPSLKLFRRQFYHFRDTQLPMRPGDWEFDSEDESDNEWLEEYATGGINEFTDLSYDEKKFILLWNDFFRCGTWVLPGNRSIVDRLYSFLQENIDELVNLQQQVLLKLLNLLDQCVISDSELDELMAYLLNLAEAKSHGQGGDASNRELTTEDGHGTEEGGRVSLAISCVARNPEIRGNNSTVISDES